MQSVTGVKEIFSNDETFAALKEDGSLGEILMKSSQLNPSKTILIHSWQTSSDNSSV